jgi:hypothetical protein
MTLLNPYVGTSFIGTELFEIVSPGIRGSSANYKITAAQLAALIPKFGYVNTIITTGATVGNPYLVPITVNRVLLAKAAPSASEVQFGPSASYPGPVLVKDLLGDADVNPITVTFAAGEECDGLASVQIGVSYGAYVFNPLASGGWYLGTA